MLKSGCASSCRTLSCGEPLGRVPLGPTAHWAIGPSLPDLGVSLRGFRPLRRARKGLCPFHPYHSFRKRMVRKLGVSMLRVYLTECASSCRTSSCGEPLGRVPLGPTAHWVIGPSLPDLWVSLGDFAFCGKRGGRCPPPCQPFKKGWTENLGFLRCGRHFAGCLNPSLRSLARGSSAAAT